jgi:hypothetical protein
MAKGTKSQSSMANGPAPSDAFAQCPTTGGGLNLRAPEERQRSIVDWARTQMVQMGYCTTIGEPKNPMNIDFVRTTLQLKRPDVAQEITAALKE